MKSIELLNEAKLIKNWWKIMRIMIGMHHPKQFWLFKNLIKVGKKKGWKFEILISKKDVLEELLKIENIEYKIIGVNQSEFFRKIIEINKWIRRGLKYSNKFQPDIFLSRSLPHFSFLSVLKNKPFIIFEDSEPVELIHKFTLPFASTIITPSSFRRDLGKKQLRINTYDELYYLHPNWFTPNIKILEKYGINKNDKYAILRFVSWHAHHDIRKYGLDLKMKKRIIKLLKEKDIKIFISSEGKLENEFSNYNLNINPHEIHHLLAFSTLYIGDSQTMATEAALLGTPSIRCNSFVGKNDMGNFIELENKYKLMYNFSNPNHAIERANELINKNNLKEEWLKKTKKVLQEKIDATSFIIGFIENYPESAMIKAKNPELKKYS